LPKRCFFNIF